MVQKLLVVVMYIIWILAIIFILATTFTNFQYLDLNVIALVLFGFALLNTFFNLSRRRQ